MRRQASPLMQGTRSLMRSNHMCARRVAPARMQKSEVSVVSLTSRLPDTPIHYSSVALTALAQNSVSRLMRACTILSVRADTIPLPGLLKKVCNRH
jgi:hypothetical protein